MTHLKLESDMHIAQNIKATPHPRRSRTQALVLGAALLLGVQNAHAGGVPVIDVTAIMQDFRSWLDDTWEYAKEATRWNEIKQQIDDARALFSALNFAMDLPLGEKLEKVDPRYLVAETCGQDAMGLNMSTAFSLLGFNSESDFKQQQKQICVNIRMMQNRKFNDSVDFIDKTMKQAEQAMLENFLARTSGSKANTTGNVQAADSDARRLNNQLNVMAQQWSTRMQSYDAYIATMEANQNQIARAALKGNPKNKIIGDVVQTIALKGALSVD